jgi:hypothetical protein
MNSATLIYILMTGLVQIPTPSGCLLLEISDFGHSWFFLGSFWVLSHSLHINLSLTLTLTKIKYSKGP